MQADSFGLEHSTLKSYLSAICSSFDSIPGERKKDLRLLSGYIRGRLRESAPVRLVFICTHNSRRSHLGQVWAAIGAGLFGIRGVETYSGGTEATAFNPRAVAALRRSGLAIDQMDMVASNPPYRVMLLDGHFLVCYSKRYDDEQNPSLDFAAIMTCSDADERCPHIPGASFRLALPYADPKEADDSEQETARYDERCRQIAIEMLYVFSLVKEGS